MIDARDIPLDEYEQETLERLLRAHAERSVPSSGEGARVARWGRQARRARSRGGRSPLSPIGRGWQARLVGTVLLGLVAASAAVAAVSILGGSSAPVQLYGKDLCPTNYAYAAQVSTKVVYPPNYPGRGFPQRGSIRCFASLEYARAAGYRIAPVPAGYAQIGPIYLAPAPLSVRRTCRAAQRMVKAAVYCPTRLPTPWIHPALNWDCPTSDCFAPLLSLTGSFTAPNSFVGSVPGVGEATMWSASRRQQRVFPYLVGCFSNPARLVSRTTFRGHPAAWYDCSIWGGSTSTMLEWRIGKESYGITADGPPGLRRALVAYIAKHLVVERS